MRSIDQIGASFEDHKSNYRYSYLFDRAPDDSTADEYIRNAPKKKKQKSEPSQTNRTQKTAGTIVGSKQRKPAKPIQQTLFADVLENDRREVLIFDLLIETLEPGRYCPARRQRILLIHKTERFEPSILTKEQYRLYQNGSIHQRLLTFSAQTPQAQNMLRQHVTKKTFGYETEEGRHLVTIRAWK